MGQDVERDRVLSEAELILLFQQLERAGMADTSQAALLCSCLQCRAHASTMRAQYEGTMREDWRLLGERLDLLMARAQGVAENVVTFKAA